MHGQKIIKITNFENINRTLKN